MSVSLYVCHSWKYSYIRDRHYITATLWTLLLNRLEVMWLPAAHDNNDSRDHHLQNRSPDHTFVNAIVLSLTCSSLCFHCCQPSAGIPGSPAAGLRSSLAIPDRVTQGGGALDFWGIFLKARLRNWQKERHRLMQTLDMTIIATIRSDYRLLMAFCCSAPRSSGSVSLSVPRITTASFQRRLSVTWDLFSATNYLMTGDL